MFPGAAETTAPSTTSITAKQKPAPKKLINPFEANLLAEKEQKDREEAERTELLRKKKLEAENKRKAQETAAKAEADIRAKLEAKKEIQRKKEAEERAL